MKIVIFLLLIIYFPQISNAQKETKESDRIANSSIDICPVKIGEEVPKVSINNLDGEEIDLQDLVSQQPTILIFYRGGWCPYCNLHLAELITIENELLDIGYKIIALSMDKPELLKESIDKYQMKYELYSDSKANAAKAFGLAFRVTEAYYEKLKSHNMDIENASGQRHHILPVPAVFIIKDGIIKFEYINPDYKERINKEVLLQTAKIYMK